MDFEAIFSVDVKSEIKFYHNICLVFISEIEENKKKSSNEVEVCVAQNNIFPQNELYFGDRFAVRSDEFGVWLTPQQTFLKRKNKKNSKEIDWAVI